MKMLTPILLILIFISFSFQEDVYKEKREKMVKDQIEKRGVSDKLVLKAMQNVKRHQFVPEERIAEAYDDGPLPIGYGQTISQPYIVAYMTEVIQCKPEFKVLEIGTGSGYQAAVLAEIVKEVYTIEIVTELANAAAERLKKLGYSKVKVKQADGYYGWKENGPYDAIVVTAAAEFVPPPLIEQLKENGKMVIPIGSPFMTQTLMLIEKKGKKITTKNLLTVRFVPFTRKK
ncbi:MAG TPA: protein-L-isoaspartate(D-aspartate) O-methyltransferase [Chitinophagaceae bacterium]|jgi:protein-L-isoaspartate(D-aspartate) O-methyltransferase|nr:protein-L-isoaspartate(D-aspartate) O-methyltransferase [Chitinophagaceae bacterium]